MRARVVSPSPRWLLLALAVACDGGSGDTPDDGAAGNPPSGGSAGSSAGSGGNAAAGSSGRGGAPSGGAGAAGSNAGRSNSGGSSTGGSGSGDSGAGGSSGTDAGSSNGGGGAGSAGTPGAGADAGGAGGDAGASGSAGTGGGEPPSLLVFSRTTGFRHGSIGVGIQALQGLADERAWSLVATEDPSVFSDSGLADFDVVVFLSTTGDVLDAEQQASFERFMRAGHGFVGIHSASDTEYDWPFYGALVGAYFRAHPAVQSAEIVVEDSMHPASAALPERWTRTDEWYAFQANPRANVAVLLSLDEASYSPADAGMGGDHPIAWYHEYEGARAFYTALGHTDESYAEPLFLGHIAGGVEWAARAQ
ncbi:MAG TPA: ThuA domain-containing protein [Polyangiaceae bacterium]